MPMFPKKVHSSNSLLKLSGALTRVLNAYDLSADRNVVVYAFAPEDVPEWESLPPIWHQYDGATLCVNMGKLYRAMFDSFPGDKFFDRPLTAASRERGATLAMSTGPDGEGMVVATPQLISDLVRTIENRFQASDIETADRRYNVYLSGDRLNTTPIEKTHSRLSYNIENDWDISGVGDTTGMLYNILIGAIIREAGYAVINQPISYSDWFKRATGYQRNIITVFEELRVEAQQIARINADKKATARRFMRSAIPATANVEQIIADMTQIISSGDQSGVSMAALGLNSSLILGRVPISTLLQFEVASIRDHVDTFVGTDRLEKMEKIWEEYVALNQPNEEDIMPLVRRWEELFPSDESGENAKSSVAPAPPQDGEGDEDGEGGEGESAPGAPDSKGKPSKGKPSKSGEKGQKEPGDAKGGKGDEGDGEEGEGAGGKGKGDQDGDENGDGDGEGNGDSSSGTGEQQEAPGTYERTNEDFEGGGTKGAHANAMGAKNLSQVNSDSDPVDEILEMPGAAAALRGEFDSKPADPINPTQSATYDNQEFGPKDITPSRISYAKAQHRHATGKPSDISRGKEIEPSNSDFAAASQLAKVLENLNIYDRGKFTKDQITPPGRMKSRAAVQQAAERTLKLAPNAKPWARTMRTVDMNPPLTVGIMTDVSGSMGWAEQLSAKLAWIVQHAVSTINGRVASLAFGEGATVVLRPGEKLHHAQVVSANNGGEEFDMGAGTMDVMLNLVHGTGTRMLFVITDGYFVFENMMEKAAAWIDLLTSKGVHIVWITPDKSAMKPVEERDRNYDSPLTYTPDKTIPVRADGLQYARSTEDREIETRKLIQTVGTQIQKAVRESKHNSR